MSGSGGFYKYRCKYFYTHNCPNWVYCNGHACAMCLVSHQRHSHRLHTLAGQLILCHRPKAAMQQTPSQQCLHSPTRQRHGGIINHNISSSNSSTRQRH